MTSSPKNSATVFPAVQFHELQCDYSSNALIGSAQASFSSALSDAIIGVARDENPEQARIIDDATMGT